LIHHSFEALLVEAIKRRLINLQLKEWCFGLRQKLVVYSDKVEVIEHPCVVVKESILVKPIYVYLGELERHLLEGSLPSTHPVVLGGSGVVRVVEVQGGETELIGRVYTVTPIGPRGLLGYEEDGLLGNFVSIPRSYLDDLLVDPRPIDAVRPLVKHAYALVAKISEPVLIEGCNLLGIAAGLILRYMGVEALFYCEQRAKSALQYSFNVYKHISELTSKWGSVILTGINQSVKYKLLQYLATSIVVISPLSTTSWIPITSHSGEAKILVPRGGEAFEHSTMKRVLDDLSRGLKVLEVDDVKSVLGLLPPRGLGVIVSLRRD
jgi:hypothetical protein